MAAQLISPAQLNSQLNDPKLRLFDCRFQLEDPSYGARSFAQGHIPGAQFLDLERDLSAPVQKGITGRHPLPQAQTLSARLRELGVDQDSFIVLYDDGPGAFAARAWWLLSWLGHPNIALLDGGLKAWQAANLPVNEQTAHYPAGDFNGQPNNALLLSADELQARLNDPALTLIDARGLPRFRGDVEPMDPVAGHIPGAQCAVFTDNLNAKGCFKSAGQLRERFATFLNHRDPQELVAYCGSGVTACHNLFSLTLAGYPLPRLYAGSWSEWITDPKRPCARGD